MAYGVESDFLEERKVLSEAFEGGDDADCRIGDTGRGILLVVSRTRELL